MPALSRRRFIAISAAAMAAGPAGAGPVTRWAGVALGARTSITLVHPDAERVVRIARDEITRLEGVFSLYRAGSALSRLNRDGVLDTPPFEFVECLGIAGLVHEATGGAFDPTIQPLWSTYAEALVEGRLPSDREIAAARGRVGWATVDVAPDRVAFRRPGMAMTLNGIAQGYIADRVTRLLDAEGLENILVDTGELRALGGVPGGGDWTVHLPDGRRTGLRDRALATSAPLGTVLDAGGTIGHILDPRSGRPAAPSGRSVTITAPSAALADAVSTALCLLDDQEGEDVLRSFRGCRRVLA